MHCTWNHRKHTRDTEGIFHGLRNGLKRRKAIPMLLLDHIIKMVEDWGRKLRRDQYGKGIDLCNSNKELFDLVNEELEEYLGVF